MIVRVRKMLMEGVRENIVRGSLARLCVSDIFELLISHQVNRALGFDEVKPGAERI